MTLEKGYTSLEFYEKSDCARLAFVLRRGFLAVEPERSAQLPSEARGEASRSRQRETFRLAQADIVHHHVVAHAMKKSCCCIRIANATWFGLFRVARQAGGSTPTRGIVWNVHSPRGG